MAFDLHVDAARWRASVAAVAERLPGLAPVVKAGGYGFGRETLAAEAARLGVRTVAVGTYDELPSVRDTFPGDLLVLAPWRPSYDGSCAPVHDPRFVHTVTRGGDLAALERLPGPPPRVVVEVLTSMRRHGMALDDVAAAVADHPGVRLEGVALHLPLGGDVLAEAVRLGTRLRAAGLAAPLWVSHLDGAGAAELSRATGLEVRLRVGTALWLGDRGALCPRAAVLDVHELRRGERYGYRGRRAPGRGWLVIAAGGTAHGVGLDAPRALRGPLDRAKALAHGGLEATGLLLSPFTWAGRKRRFAEPPHMQVSMLWLPHDVDPPAVGDQLDVEVRFTTTTFDRVVGLDPLPGPGAASLLQRSGT